MFEIPLSDLVLEKLQRQSEIPLQRQLYQIIHEAINAGKLATDCKLPSSRYLSKEVDISRITVSLVYERLVSEGYLYSKKGSGTYVSKLITPLKPPPNLSEPSPWVYSERGAKLLRNESSPPQPYGEFVPGIADIEAFPFYLWRKILAKYYSKKYYDLSSYAESGGYIELRRAIASYLSVSRSLHCDPDQVIVTFGTPQSLDLCARMLSDPGEEAYIEDPAHWATQSIFEAAGLNIRSIPLDEEGIHSTATGTIIFALIFIIPVRTIPYSAIENISEESGVLTLHIDKAKIDMIPILRIFAEKRYHLFSGFTAEKQENININ